MPDTRRRPGRSAADRAQAADGQPPPPPPARPTAALVRSPARARSSRTSRASTSESPRYRGPGAAPRRGRTASPASLRPVLARIARGPRRRPRSRGRPLPAPRAARARQAFGGSASRPLRARRCAEPPLCPLRTRGVWEWWPASRSFLRLLDLQVSRGTGTLSTQLRPPGVPACWRAPLSRRPEWTRSSPKCDAVTANAIRAGLPGPAAS